MASRSRSRSRSDHYKVFLTKMNGDTLTYKLPLTVRELKYKLPDLASDTTYRIINGTNVLKDVQRLEGMDYHINVTIVKSQMASWCPTSWNGVVPDDVCDRYGVSSASTKEAGQAIYSCMKVHYPWSRLRHDDSGIVKDDEVEDIIGIIKDHGWYNVEWAR